MSSFTESLTVTKIGIRLWKVERNFTYIVERKETLESIEVEKGFITDFASVPRIFWVIFPPDGKYTQAAVLHDWLYHIRTCSRKEADYIFFEAMGVLGVNLIKRRIMWIAVRLLGWIPYNLKRKNETTH